MASVSASSLVVVAPYEVNAPSSSAAPCASEGDDLEKFIRLFIEALSLSSLRVQTEDPRKRGKRFEGAEAATMAYSTYCADFGDSKNFRIYPTQIHSPPRTQAEHKQCDGRGGEGVGVGVGDEPATCLLNPSQGEVARALLRHINGGREAAEITALFRYLSAPHELKKLSSRQDSRSTTEYVHYSLSLPETKEDKSSANFWRLVTGNSNRCHTIWKTILRGAKSGTNRTDF